MKGMRRSILFIAAMSSARLLFASTFLLCDMPRPNALLFEDTLAQESESKKQFVWLMAKASELLALSMPKD
jgi:hypothetical protein